MLQVRLVFLQLLGEQIDSLLTKADVCRSEPATWESSSTTDRLEREHDPANRQEERYFLTNLYTHALCLTELGREDEARQAFLECLEAAKRARPGIRASMVSLT